jgi:hypothetical protein
MARGTDQPGSETSCGDMLGRLPRVIDAHGLLQTGTESRSPKPPVCFTLEFK